MKMAKKTKRKWAPTWAFFSNAPPLVLFCQNQNQRRGLNQLEFFLQLVARPVLGGGGGFRTVVGEKSPTSPAFCNSWDAMFMRVKVNRVVNLLPGFLSQLLIFCKKKKTKRYALFLFVRSVTLL